MSNRVVIDQSVNTVTTDTTSTQNNVILSPDNPDVVRVVENTSNIVTIGVPGPRGSVGATGSQGPAGTDFYTTNGTVTGNRIVTIDDKQLIFRSNPSILQNYTYSIGIPTGMPASTWPSSIVYEGEYLMSIGNAEPYNTRVWGRNQTSSNKSLWVNQVYADITAESTGTTNLYNQYFVTRRGTVLDTSTTAAGTMRGVSSVIGHAISGVYATTTNIVTNEQVAFASAVNNSIGTAVNTYSYKASSAIYTFSAQNTLVTNYYAFHSELFVGYPGYTGVATLTNYYGLFLNTPTLRGTSVITNRWGVYAPDSTMNNYLNGNLSLGTSETGSNKLLVVGSTKLNGNVDVTGSISVSQNISASNAIFTGTITAQTLVVQTITSSIEFITGSTRFGSFLTDTHEFTGSVNITGSLNATASNSISSSYAVTASYALNAAGAGSSVGGNLFNYYNFT